MRKKFKFSDIEDSSSYYSPFFDAIYEGYLQWENRPESILPAVYYGYVFELINTYNRVCNKLFADGEMLAFVQFIRNLIEMTVCIYADNKWPFTIFTEIYDKQRQFDKIKRNGHCIDPSILRKEIDTKFGSNLDDLYEKYCAFLHPNSNQITLGNNDDYSFFDDLITINQTITNILLAQLEQINSKINNNEPDNV